MMCLRKLALTLAMAILISVTLFPLYAKSYEQPTQEFVKNCSFEVRDYGPPWPCGGVYSCPPWETNNGGWREEPADINGNGLVEGLDYGIFAAAWGSHGPDIPNPGDPPSDNWNPDCDFNGNGYVEGLDYGIFGEHWGHTANRMDGAYSWFTSGGGNYTMWQWLDNDYVMALAGETVKFSFSFYPESVASNGSQNNARAEIYYEYPGGSNTVYGVWVGPTELNWWDAYVIANLPSTVYLVAVIIHGTPDFKAWVDLAQLTTSGYSLYYTYPPYDNLDTYPENGHCITWYKYPEFAIAKVCVYADKTTGQVSAYSWDASGIGTEREAYAKFNMNPPPGNSPQVYENDDFRVGAYWIAYGYLGSSGPAASRVSIQLYVYYLKLGVGWQHVKTYEWFFSSLEYPNQEIFYSGSVSKLISPPSGSGYYTIAPRARTYAVNLEGGSAVADFFNAPYCMFVSYIKMSD